MEVHKHPHHVTHKKKWPEYFLEFLMIFLAVFLGFVAENKREQLVDKKKAREYMSSLYQDLRIDDKQLEALIPQFKERDQRMDTMLTLLKAVSKNTGANGLYNYFYLPMGYPDFIYTDRTIKQLENSGALRLISGKEISDSIILYDASVKQIGINVNESIADQLHLLRQMTVKIFDFKCCPEIGQFERYNNISYPNPGSLLTYDDKLLTEYYNDVQFIRRTFNRHRIFLEELKDQNNRLQELLKKDYQLE
jgi:hypothetical protein